MFIYYCLAPFALAALLLPKRPLGALLCVLLAHGFSTVALVGMVLDPTTTREAKVYGMGLPILFAPLFLFGIWVVYKASPALPRGRTAARLVAGSPYLFSLPALLYLILN